MLPESLKEEIFRHGKFVCGITLKIYSQYYNKDNEYEKPLIEEYTFRNKLYGRINNNSFLTLEIKKGLNDEDDIRRRAMILEYEIYDLLDNLREISSAINSDRIFKLVRNEKNMLTYVTNDEYLKMFTRQIILKLSIIGIRPSLVKRRDSTNIEVIEKGVEIVINSPEFKENLSLNELRYLLNILKNIDIKARATSMFNQYVMYKILCDSERPSAKVKAFSSNNNNLFSTDNTNNKESVTNTIKHIKDVNPFMDL